MTDLTTTPLLSPVDATQLSGLWFTARRMVEGLYAGRHRSPRRGHSTEFYDFRAYLPGDEPRRVDWKLYGRTDRLYIRRFRHDADLAMHLIVDRSRSMDFSALRPGPVPTKLDYARQVAAALAYLAVQQQDRVSLTFIADAADPALPLGGTFAHLRAVIEALERVGPGGRTEPAAALHEAHARLARAGGARASRSGRGLVILISDLLRDPAAWLSGLGPFCHDAFDVAVLHVLAPDELDLGKLGAAELVDAETGRRARTVGTDTPIATVSPWPITSPRCAGDSPPTRSTIT